MKTKLLLISSFLIAFGCTIDQTQGLGVDSVEQYGDLCFYTCDGLIYFVDTCGKFQPGDTLIFVKK